MAKRYGLIIPGQEKTSVPTLPPIKKASVFDESSDSSDNDAAFKKPTKKASATATMLERRKARLIQERALEEDPTVFQYDELYDDMEAQREQKKEIKSNEPKKSKYIGRLMEFSERRKLENELRVERQVQKERENEGETFKDKESFVTLTYRKKLEELRLLEEKEKRDEYLEAIGDVTKQKDLDGFYRHIYEQKLGTSKQTIEPIENQNNEEIIYKPIKSGKPQNRAYRKRHSSEDEDGVASQPADTKKVHLQNNIDADSDFSIESSSDEDDESCDKTNIEAQNLNFSKNHPKEENISKILPEVIDKERKEDEQHRSNDEKSPEKEEIVPPKPKRDKSEIWKKRTIGETFEAAVQRYLERKAALNV